MWIPKARPSRCGFVILALLAGLLAAGLPPESARAHDPGNDEFPCEVGFGVPGLEGNPSELGQWGPVMDWPIQATHAALLSTGKVLIWRGRLSHLWDPTTGALGFPHFIPNFF